MYFEIAIYCRRITKIVDLRTIVCASSTLKNPDFAVFVSELGIEEAVNICVGDILVIIDNIFSWVQSKEFRYSIVVELMEAQKQSIEDKVSIHQSSTMNESDSDSENELTTITQNDIDCLSKMKSSITSIDVLRSCHEETNMIIKDSLPLIEQLASLYSQYQDVKRDFQLLE